MAKEAFYFSHDSNARHDPKILAMRSVFGIECYGWYWVIIEMLREQEDYKIKITKHVYHALAMQMQCDGMQAQCFIDACINEHELLHSDGEYFWSESLLKKMKIKDNKSEKAKKAAQTRWGKPKGDKGSMQTHSERNANAMQGECDSNAIKEKKEKEMNEKKIKQEEVVEEVAGTQTLHEVFKMNFNYEPTPAQMNLLRSYIDQDGMEENLVKWVLTEVGERGKDFAYAKGWLNRSVSSKILTLMDAKKANEEHERKKQISIANSNIKPFNNPVKVRLAPDWLKNNHLKDKTLKPHTEEENAKWLEALLTKG